MFCPQIGNQCKGSIAVLLIYSTKAVLIRRFLRCHISRDLWKSCPWRPFPCILTLRSLSLISGASRLLSFVRIRFCCENVLSQSAVWSGKVRQICASLIGRSFPWCTVRSCQRSRIWSTGYLRDLTIPFAADHSALTAGLGIIAGNNLPLWI